MYYSLSARKNIADLELSNICLPLLSKHTSSPALFTKEKLRHAFEPDSLSTLISKQTLRGVYTSKEIVEQRR